MSKLVEDEFYLQDKRQYVGNDILWWAKARMGYTTDLSKAEVFTKEEAMAQHRCRPDIDIPWPKKYVDNKTRPAVDMQCVDLDIALQDNDIKLIEPPKPKIETHKCGHCGRFCTEDDWWSRVYNGSPCRKCQDDL